MYFISFVFCSKYFNVFPALLTLDFNLRSFGKKKAQNLSLNNPKHHGYRWIDLDEQCQNDNKLNPNGGTSEELSSKDFKNMKS
jgi:hypothetical protein